MSTIKSINTNETDLEWYNVGGQLIPQKNVKSLLNKIKADKVTEWDQIHDFYEKASLKYEKQKTNHAIYVLALVTKSKVNSISVKQLNEWLNRYLLIQEHTTKSIQQTRAKDYSNSFRKMVYLNEEEMKAVVGDIKDNGFIKENSAALASIIVSVSALKTQLKIK
ncbi:MAG: hypothetical protein ACOVJ8_08460 [Sediminibacterium sp.]